MTELWYCDVKWCFIENEKFWWFEQIVFDLLKKIKKYCSLKFHLIFFMHFFYWFGLIPLKLPLSLNPASLNLRLISRLVPLLVILIRVSPTLRGCVLKIGSFTACLGGIKVERHKVVFTSVSTDWKWEKKCS